MRSATTLLLSLAMAIGAIGLAFAAPGMRGGEELPEVDLRTASGALQIANSRAGQSVFTAGGMRPGQTVDGVVTIGNDGELAGSFSVRATHISDTPGSHGGKLSQRMRLVLLDVTDPQAPVTVFSGSPADLDQVALGTFAPGQERDYRFEARLPQGGAPASAAAGDNRFQGAGLSLGFEWQATASAVATPTPTPTPTPTVPPTATPEPTPVTPQDTPPSNPPVAPPTAPAIADILGLPASTSCVKRGKIALRLKAPVGLKALSATIKVNGKTKAKLKGKKATRKVTLKKLGKKPAKVVVRVRASNGRTYSATRTYGVCR